MNTRVLIAALVAGVVGFLLGWVIWGMALMGYYEANMIHYEGLMKAEGEMNLALMFVSNLCVGVVVAYACDRMGAKTLASAAVASAIIGFFFYLSIDLSFMSMMNMFSNTTVMVVDVIAYTVWIAVMGAAAGAVLGMGAKKA
ncbi:MAG: hypothetical protein IPL52_11755 [Flavobacteriales bacterium]|nr:hypothetical protein [Flavobacteriales bacterium]